MNAIREAWICGAGAIGSSYAERLDAAAVPFRVVARGERRERLEREGLTVNGRRVAVRCVSPGDDVPPAALVFVAVKQHQLADAIADLRGLVGPDTIVVSLLNGITSEGLLARGLGSSNVLHAFTLQIDAVRSGTTTRYSTIGKLVIGAPSNDRRDPRVLAVAELIGAAGITVIVPDDIHREQWWKFMINVGVNQVSAVLRAPYGAFALPELQALTRAAALEAVAVARCEGVALAPADVETIFPIMARLAPDGQTSMLQDVLAGRKTEVEIFGGTVVELGAKHGVPTPVNDVLVLLLRACERLAGVSSPRSDIA